jgi:flagellar protein FlgJ
MNPIDTTVAGAAPADSDPAIAPAMDARYVAKATRAAIQFEGFFISHMLHQMRSGTRELAGEDSIFKNPANNDLLDLADTMVADQMAGQRAFGIADAILRQLLPPASAKAGPLAGPAPDNLSVALNKRR